MATQLNRNFRLETDGGTVYSPQKTFYLKAREKGSMKDYKRVTIRHEDGSHSFMYDYNATTPQIKILLDRLAELEDEIENGMLVELPCKEGDIVYFVNWHRHPPRIEAFKVDHLEVNKNYIRVACYDFENEDNYSMYRIDSKDISFSKEEALKKIE